MKVQKKQYAIIPIALTVFLDLLGLGIVIPILPAILLDPIGGILPLNYSYTVRILMYGFLVASYPIAQFFGAPVLGTLADGYGRKKLLLLSLCGTLIGYIIFVTGILQGNVILLFIGRMIDGFTGGNISVAQSAIADISNEKTKARNFGLIGMCFGLGFVIGPFIGGKLSDPYIYEGFTYATPFFVSIVLTVINIILVCVNLQETIINKRAVRIDFFTGFKNIKSAFSFHKLRVMFLVVFLLNIGHNFFTQFLQVFLMGKFGFTQSKVADFFCVYGNLDCNFTRWANETPLEKIQFYLYLKSLYGSCCICFAFVNITEQFHMAIFHHTLCCNHARDESTEYFSYHIKSDGCRQTR